MFGKQYQFHSYGEPRSRLHFRLNIKINMELSRRMQPPIQYIAGVLSPGLKRKVRETNYSPSTAEAKKSGAVFILLLMSSWHRAKLMNRSGNFITSQSTDNCWEKLSLQYIDLGSNSHKYTTYISCIALMNQMNCCVLFLNDKFPQVRFNSHLYYI